MELPEAVPAAGVFAEQEGPGGEGSQGGALARSDVSGEAGVEAMANAGDAADGAPRAEKKVIAYSLYGSNPKYVLGAERNAVLIHTVFPGWVARFYVDAATVPETTLAALRRHGAELVPIDMAKREGLRRAEECYTKPGWGRADLANRGREGRTMRACTSRPT
jgi:hypothetical protein